MHILVVLVLVLATCVAKQRPNIVVIVADDLGWNDVSFHGSDQIPTPNIDRLARQGIILNNYYVQQMCTPTRAALLTGRYPIHTGMHVGVIADAQPYGLGLDEKLLPQYLNELGYSSHAVGKWHLGLFAKEYTPTYRGFKSHFGILLGVGDYWDHTCQGTYLGEWGLDFRDNMTIAKDYFGQYSTDVYTNKTVDIIRDHDTAQPLFVYMAHQAIHRGNYVDPLQAQNKYYQRLAAIKDPDRRTVAAMVTNMDESVGEVYRALEEKNMLHNTIIVFTSDNGGPTAHFDDNMANNWPLRGMKGTLWEGGVRVPGFIWSPLLESRSRTSHQLLHVTDWLPTLLSAAGATKINHTKPLDGHDQWATLSLNESSQRHETVHQIDGHIFSIRIGDFKLLEPDWGMRPRFGWYPPPGWDDSSDTTLRFKSEPNFSNFHAEYIPYISRYRHNHKYRNYSLERIVEKLSQSSSKYPARNSEDLVVDCGPRVPDADFNCRPGVPCLYHIPSDPCEFTNLYDREADIVWMMYERMLQYKKGVAPPRNKPEDPRGFPSRHGGVWGPWVTLDGEGNPIEGGDDVIVGAV